LVEADLLNADSLDKAIKGCDYVVHTASPFPLGAPVDENSIIRPAVDGTVAVMKACHKYKIKRVVITSSIAAVFEHAPNDRKPVYNESDWSDPKACGVYTKSKLLAEKAAWDFLQQLPDNEKFELVTVMPGFVQGPTFVYTDFSSG